MSETADEAIRRVGETITKLREAAGLSQKEFAAAVEMSQSLISRLENGSQEPGLTKLTIIAGFFGLTLGRLLDGETSRAVVHSFVLPGGESASAALRRAEQERDKAIRERDSLARRCALRFEETEKLRAEVERLTAEVIEAELDQARVERDWLLAEAPDDLRRRFFAVRAKEGGAVTEINWQLIEQLAVKPHPTLNDQPCNCSNGCGEIVQEARAVSHLLDMAGIPKGSRYYDTFIDARTYLAVVEISSLRERLDRIAAWHARETADGGMVGDFCVDCGQRWPCETRRMADGTHKDLTEQESAR